MPKPNYDLAIMAELLERPSAKKDVAKLTERELEMYKELLLQPRGWLPSIYEQYVKERKAK